MKRILYRLARSLVTDVLDEREKHESIAALERQLNAASESIALELGFWAAGDVIARRELTHEHAERLRDLNVIADSARAALRDARGS